MQTVLLTLKFIYYDTVKAFHKGLSPFKDLKV